MPALQTMMSSLPNSLTASFTISATCSSLVTSTLNSMAFLPVALWIFSAAICAFSKLISPRMTWHPSAASLRAIASPSPCPAPVTMALFPLSISHPLIFILLLKPPLVLSAPVNDGVYRRTVARSQGLVLRRPSFDTRRHSPAHSGLAGSKTQHPSPMNHQPSTIPRSSASASRFQNIPSVSFV